MRFSRIPIYLLTILITLSLAVPVMAGEIHLAAAGGDLDKVKDLLAGDATLISAPNQNATRDLPLHSAATDGQLEVIRFLVESGADSTPTENPYPPARDGEDLDLDGRDVGNTEEDRDPRIERFREARGRL